VKPISPTHPSVRFFAAENRFYGFDRQIAHAVFIQIIAFSFRHVTQAPALGIIFIFAFEVLPHLLPALHEHILAHGKTHCILTQTTGNGDSRKNANNQNKETDWGNHFPHTRNPSSQWDTAERCRKMRQKPM